MQKRKQRNFEQEADSVRRSKRRKTSDGGDSDPGSPLSPSGPLSPVAEESVSQRQRSRGRPSKVE